MSKIICDICGTTYPDSAESCPICGCTRDSAAEFLGAEVPTDEVPEEATVLAGAAAAANKKKEIFDFDEVNSEETYDEDEDDDDDDYDEEEDEEEGPRHNTFVIILLTILIIALLAAAAFIFFRYFLPNKAETEPVEPSAVQHIEETTEATTEPTVPCEHITMTNAGIAELNAEGQQFLLHIKAIPEHTTDPIIYTSGDESIATVTEDGKITAISEGETIVYISCGKYSIECPVIVKYVEETVPPTTAATEPVVEETVPETTEAVVTDNSNVTLKLKKTDIQLGVYYEFQLQLDCELNPEDVTWTSEHPHIAKVDEKGNVTALKEGTTSVKATYGSQEVQCIVRCVWY